MRIFVSFSAPKSGDPKKCRRMDFGEFPIFFASVINAPHYADSPDVIFLGSISASYFSGRPVYHPSPRTDSPKKQIGVGGCEKLGLTSLLFRGTSFPPPPLLPQTPGGTRDSQEGAKPNRVFPQKKGIRPDCERDCSRSAHIRKS